MLTPLAFRFLFSVTYLTPDIVFTPNPRGGLLFVAVEPVNLRPIASGPSLLDVLDGADGVLEDHQLLPVAEIELDLIGVVALQDGV